MVVSAGPDTSSEAELKKDYPITEGLTLGTTKIDGRRPSLEAEGFDGIKSIVPEERRKLIKD